MQSIAGFFRKVISPNPDDNCIEQTSELGENSPQTDTKPKGEHSSSTCQQEMVQNEEYTILKDTVYDLIKDIRDPEKPETLEELNVVSEDSVSIHQFNTDDILVKIVFVPTVPHCSLASLIGLCMRQKLVQNLPDKHKLDIFIKEGTHETAEEINKQINDKERIAAAMENPNLRDLVNKCIDEEESYR